MATETLDSPWRSEGGRAQYRDAKRDAVLLAAARLFTRNGFQGTSLDDIAASLSVSKPTLYHYVENKEEILFECARRGLAALRDGIDALDGQGSAGRERLRAAMQSYADVATSDYGLCVIRVGEDPLSEARRHELRALKGQIDELFRDLVQAGMDEGWIVSGDAAVAAATVVSSLSGIGRWYRPDSHTQDSLRDAVDHCIEMLMRGVLAVPCTADAAAAAPTPPVSAAATRRELHFGGRVLRCFTERPRNLAAMLTETVAQRADGDALVCAGLRLTWRELHHAAVKCAGGLSQRGVGPGDRVALLLGNGAEFVIATLACAWMGAVLVPISERARGAELHHVLADSGAVAIICAAELTELLADVSTLPALRHRFSTAAAPASSFEPLMALMQAEPLTVAHHASEEDLAVLLYTSGTTGRPKGAMLTHLNIAHSVLHYVQAMALGSDTRTLVAVPMSHVTGLVAQLYTMLQCRGCLVLLPQFKAAEFVRTAEAERITHTIMVPAMYNLCLLLPDLRVHDLRAWRVGAYGGAAMPTASIEALAQRLPGLTLMNAYGATETCSPATIMPAGQTGAHPDSVGVAVTCGDLFVADDEGCEVPRGSAGELWIGGPMVSAGYWNNAHATASEFRGGFWRSGDIGSVDAEGYVRILDRKKDVIIRGGYKVYCVAVENTLVEHPQVVEAALVGVPCAVLGERVHAFVCVRALDQGTQAQALKGFCAGRLADYAVPETWTIGTDPLPRNLNGKVMKRALRQTLNAALT